MANTILTISMITNKALAVLENELTFTSRVNREYSDQFAIEGAKIGDTVNVRRPGRFIGTSGPNLNVEDLYESSVPVVLGNTTAYGDQFHVDTQFTTKDLTLSLGAFTDRIMQPVIAAVANRVDFIGLQMAKNTTSNTVGVAGTPPTSFLTYTTAGAYLDAESTPKDRKARSVVIEPFTGATIVDSLKGLFTPSDKLADQYRTGMMGRDSAGMSWFMDQNVQNQVYGNWTTTAGAITVSGAGQGLASGWATSSTLTLTTTQSMTMQKGDTFTIAGVFGVNPQSRQSYGRLRQFVVNTAITANGAFSVNVSPALIFAGQFQNVTAAPATAAAVTPFSMATTAANAVSSPQNILFHKNAFTLAVADLPLPEGVHFAGRASDKDAGLSIRVVRQYTINNDALPCRFDILFGWAPLYPETACRIAA